MHRLNYNHLFYFYTVATEGSIVAASGKLNLTPQTISGQISAFEENIGTKLFDRKGKKLILSKGGQSIFGRAEAIFELGNELRDELKTQQASHLQTFSVGITDVIPKILAYQLLDPALNMTTPIKLNCCEGDQNSLLAELAVNNLDLILTDQPLQSNSPIRAYSHQLIESGFTFFAIKDLAAVYRPEFPQSLSGCPFLLQGKKSAVRLRVSSWFEKQNIVPNVIAEFDDSALMKSFGQAGYGVFTGPTLIEQHIVSQFNVEVIGRTEEIKEHYYAISPERSIKHPAVVEIVKAITRRVT